MIRIQAFDAAALAIEDRVELGRDGVDTVECSGKDEVFVGGEAAVVGHGGGVGVGEVLGLKDEASSFVDDPEGGHGGGVG